MECEIALRVGHLDPQNDDPVQESLLDQPVDLSVGVDEDGVPFLLVRPDDTQAHHVLRVFVGRQRPSRLRGTFLGIPLSDLSHKSINRPPKNAKLAPCQTEPGRRAQAVSDKVPIRSFIHD